jgi:hypothetical protein
MIIESSAKAKKFSILGILYFLIFLNMSVLIILMLHLSLCNYAITCNPVIELTYMPLINLVSQPLFELRNMQFYLSFHC